MERSRGARDLRLHDSRRTAHRVRGQVRADHFRSSERAPALQAGGHRGQATPLVTVECLRVREREGGCEVTYKPASDPTTHSTTGVIAKQETNVALADTAQAAHAQALLEALGMVRLARVEKSRTCYRDPGKPELSVVVDTVTGLGSFVETEIVSAGSHEEAVRRLEETERLLELGLHPVVTSPYRDLLLNARVHEDAVRTPVR
ncbi:CYTH domain-containing protein [Nocardiopsis eucommiae]|uniref:CYTH domain-containing protein n=1 Tax=Nocardiopsis eucommiae TaxID=2831970 RepID=A0A975QKV5_9ACTN|nr:CYTH domain-containing protein [Nocardiopsis eucommiae]